VVVVSHVGEGRRLSELLLRAFALHPFWLLGAAALQAGTYVCAAGVWQRALRASAEPRALRDLVPLGLAKLFADQALPSAGLSGTLLVVRALLQRGVPRGTAIAAMVTGLVSFYAAYGLATGVSLAVLFERGELHRAALALAAAFSLLAVGVPFALLWLRGRKEARLPRWLLRLPGAEEVRDAIAEAPADTLWGTRLGVETVGLQLGVFALDAATLAATLHAVGSDVAPGLAFASFVLASVVATLAWVPGGLGTFEGTCVGMLHLHGVSLEAALAAVLLLRGFTFWLPMAPGLWIARREMARPREAQPVPAQRA
jgi:uncharacterized membrane protein YbhN (UPF0104 family)